MFAPIIPGLLRCSRRPGSTRLGGGIEPVVNIDAATFQRTIRLHLTRRLAGIVAPADTAWLVLRGLETLAVRIDRQEASARMLAERLAAHPAVQTVRYPGFSFLVSFDVADGDAAARVERALETIENATSLGGTRSKLEARHRWEGDRIPTGLIRLSVGLEDPEALWADLERALAQA